MKRLLVMLTGLVFIILLTGCSKEEIESKSMEQIYAEEGVPVKTTSVELTEFTKSQFYYGILTGIRESSAYASFGDKIEKIKVKVGDYVKKDQVLLTFPTDVPGAQYHQAKIALETIEKTYKRMKTLLAGGAISQQDYDNVKAQYDVTKTNWETVKKMIKVKAPLTGYVTKINVRETEMVQREAELFTIANTEKLKTSIWITDEDYNDIKIGQKAIAKWNSHKIIGEVVQVDMAMNIMKQAFGVMMEFENPENAVKTGITAEIKLITEKKNSAIVINKKDIFTENGKDFVYLAKDGKAVKRFVNIGSRSGLKLEVIGGLNLNDKLISEGQMLVKDGTKIRILTKG